MEKVREQSKKITLHDGKEITMRRPKARDLITASEASNNPARQEAVIVANLCMMTVVEVEDLDADDFLKLTAERNNFL